MNLLWTKGILEIQIIWRYFSPLTWEGKVLHGAPFGFYATLGDFYSKGEAMCVFPCLSPKSGSLLRSGIMKEEKESNSDWKCFKHCGVLVTVLEDLGTSSPLYPRHSTRPVSHAGSCWSMEKLCVKMLCKLSSSYKGFILLFYLTPL